jgi:four helix bundle protein
MSVAEHAYRLTVRFPKAEVYGMTGQIRRTAISIAANIAEGTEGRTVGLLFSSCGCRKVHSRA